MTKNSQLPMERALSGSSHTGSRKLPVRTWPRRLTALAGLLSVAAGTYALFHFVILSRLPYAMFGKWQVVGGDMDGATLIFDREGSMVGIVNMKGKEGKIKAKVEVAADAMRITSVNPFTQQPETDEQKIQTLSADEFVIQDRHGTIMRMQRLRE